MILLKFYGLDAYVVGHYSKEHSHQLAELLETDEDEILFFAYQGGLFHKGIEQTSWHAYVEVSLSERFLPLEGNLAHYLLETLKDFAVHLELRFSYLSGEGAYSKINDEYPLYIEKDNLVGEIEEADEEAEEEIFLGNAFEGREDDLKALEERSHNHDHHHE